MQRLLDEQQPGQERRNARSAVSDSQNARNWLTSLKFSFPSSVKANRSPVLCMMMRDNFSHPGRVFAHIAPQFHLKMRQSIFLNACFQRLRKTIAHPVRGGNVGIGKRIGQPHRMSCDNLPKRGRR